MAIIRISQPPITREMYDAVNAKLGVDSAPPEGLIMHSAGEYDGVWQIVDVWETEEHARRFDAERLTPAIEAVPGITTPEAPPNPAVYEVHHLVLP
jgi:hypothetical protein